MEGKGVSGGKSSGGEGVVSREHSVCKQESPGLVRPDSRVMKGSGDMGLVRREMRCG